MPISAYSPIRDDNASIPPGDIRSTKTEDQQILNSIRQLMADLAVGGLFASTKVTVFTASGTFTPDAKMVECDVTGWGGGGAGGGAILTGVGVLSGGTGGNGGAKAEVKLTAAQIGASQAVTIGAGGTGVNGAAGNAGGNTTLGTLLSAKGGEGGIISAAAAATRTGPAATTQSATGDIRGWTREANGFHSAVAGISRSGETELGAGQPENVSANGSAASANTGSGGGGTYNVGSSVARTGGAGGSGLMVIVERLSS